MQLTTSVRCSAPRLQPVSSSPPTFLPQKSRNKTLLYVSYSPLTVWVYDRGSVEFTCSVGGQDGQPSYSNQTCFPGLISKHRHRQGHHSPSITSPTCIAEAQSKPWTAQVQAWSQLGGLGQAVKPASHHGRCALARHQKTFHYNTSVSVPASTCFTKQVRIRPPCLFPALYFIITQVLSMFLYGLLSHGWISTSRIQQLIRTSWAQMKQIIELKCAQRCMNCCFLITVFTHSR